jgi:putative SOS response-associated peptidase YedK
VSYSACSPWQPCEGWTSRRTHSATTHPKPVLHSGMCNRYSLSKKQERVITRDYGSLELYFMERFNIAPTQRAPVVRIENGKLATRDMHWGFAVKWTRAPVLNVQLESMEKPMFREMFKLRRCLVPASGFYEWTEYAGRRQPVRFQFTDERLFCFAGLHSPSEAGDTFAIITVPANQYVRQIHTRMPFIVAQSDYDAWLDANHDSYKQVAPASEPLKSCWINPKMNNARNDDAESTRPLIAKVKRAGPGFVLPTGLPERATVKVMDWDGDSFGIEFEGKIFKVPATAIILEGEEDKLI